MQTESFVEQQDQGKETRGAATLVAALLVIASQGLEAHADAQPGEGAGAASAQPATGTEIAPDDQPRFAERSSVKRIERRGRAMLGSGVASLGLGAALFVTDGVLLANGSDTFGMLFTIGGALLVTGAVLTPLGAKRMKWARREKQREVELSLTPTGVLICGSF